MEKRPYILYNKIQNYAWGTMNGEAFIPQLLNFAPDENTPYAELWIGTHPKACSALMIEDKKTSLLKILKDNAEEILGSYCVNKFGKQFPYLLKVLSAAEALSIQAHPDKESAKILHAKDPVNYPDDNHKPEIAIALDTLTALAGFKEAAVIKDMLNNNPEIAEFVGAAALNSPPILTDAEKKEYLKNLFENLLNKAVENPDALKHTIEALIKRISAKKDNPDKTENLFLELSAKNSSDDIGLLVVFFLELIEVNKGEAFFTGAGIPHAYIKGDIVECMANSDNVVRAGLTNKFKDISTLSKIAYYNTSPIEIEKDDKKGELKYKSPAEEFIISKLELIKDKQILHNTNNAFEVLLITNGSMVIRGIDGKTGEEYSFKKGDSILIPAVIGSYKIISDEESTIFRVTII